ncbi:hypothetical protein FACS1894152_3770 [Bacilli bacterium]|nr:hypothetical protein FACS1894152_3770 [Bacilli bacterium]
MGVKTACACANVACAFGAGDDEGKLLKEEYEKELLDEVGDDTGAKVEGDDVLGTNEGADEDKLDDVDDGCA